MIKPRTPPGVMELLPRDQIAFQRMLDTIRRTFEGFGFLPIETPVFELSETLLTKSGGETERQVYFVQSTGALAKSSESGQSEGLPELALRFDLTVPLQGEMVYGDNRVEGTEEDLTFYQDEVKIDQARKAASAGGRMTRKRTIHDLRKVAKNAAAEYISQWHVDLCFTYM